MIMSTCCLTLDHCAIEAGPAGKEYRTAWNPRTAYTVQVQLDIEGVAAEMATLQQRADALAARRPGDAVACELLGALSDFGQSLPLLRLLAASELRDRHWAGILTTLGLQV